MSLADVTSARSSPTPETCPECDATASVTSDLHKYQVACTCKPGSVQYACADDPGPPPPAKTDTPPALPPRPPTSVLATSRRTNASVGCNGQDNNCRRRKYAWWCVGCGALAAALGGLLAAQHILVRAYTASPHHLETVPAAVPAAMLVLTGVCIMSLARRRNRYSYMIKVVGACCLICALTCVLVTITTTVIHMNKLQTLKFCDYTKLTRTCTCFSMPPDSHTSSDDEGVRCVFEGVSGCGVVHGALYWCLRGVFALSVSAVLVCIFSCMLAYQLLSHERKKMYWEQLELRCRSLYRPPSGQAAAPPVQSTCNCCTQCHPTQPAWDISLQHRFWAPGRIGNLYSPNPGTGRKTSAWSWFPWPRSNSQNSRCRMGVPQSGDSAYGFCETDTPSQNPQPSYEERAYPTTMRPQNQNYPGNFTPGNFPQGSFPQGSFPQGSYGQSYQEGFGEASGSFDATTGVWGPPPPYSPQGRSGSRHHLHHQDPATATLLHHHHIDHNHTNIHTCNRNSYFHERPEIRNPDGRNPINPDLSRINPDLARINPEIRLTTDLARLNPEMARLNTDLVRLNPDLVRLNPDLVRLNPDLARLNPDMVRMSQELTHLPQMYPNEDNEVQEGRFNTLRGHLVPYRCQRLGVSASNLHRDCNESVAIECLHQKSASKVSDQSSDSCQKQGKENLGFQNDKHSPIRSSMQDCRGVNQNAESEVYFADVSSCCNVSVKAECCMNPTVSALVGTIESHAESTSESDTGSFTLTRQQRPQPQVGSKRRPRQEKHKKPINSLQGVNNSLQSINNPLNINNSSQHMNIPLQIMNNLLQQQNNSLQQINNSNQQLNNPLQQLTNSLRLTEQQIEQLNQRMNECRVNEARMYDSRDRLERLSDSRNEIDRLNERERLTERLERMNEIRMSERGNDRERLNDSTISDRINDSCLSERMNDTRTSDRMNESRIERLNESRYGNDSRRTNESLNDSRLSERMNDARTSDRMNESRIERLNESRHGNDSRRTNESLNDSRLSERMNDTRSSDRMNESRIERLNESRHGNDSRRMNESQNESRISERMSDLNSSIRIEGSPKIRSHISPRRNQKERPSLDHTRQTLDHSRPNLDHSRQFVDHHRPSNLDHSRQMDHSRPLDHPRQSSLDSKPEFFVPPPPIISPISPKTEESLLSDEEPVTEMEIPKSSGTKTLGPDSQYEQRDEKDEILKTNHHHCYSDTNTMDSGWQSGSEKQVTD